MAIRLPIYEEPPQEFTIGDEVWVRTGGCNRCGECCSNSGDAFTGDVVSHTTDGTVAEVGEPRVTTGPCRYFVWETEPTETEPGWGTCTAHDVEWPEGTPEYLYLRNGCWLWPGCPVPQFKNCSYTFTKKE